jgi:polyhydroxyalkanoate synthesis regulator phasin
MPRQIAIRLGTEGKAQVVADLDAIGTTGDAAFNRLAKSAVKAGRDADAAMEFANKQASKLAALLPGLNPTKLDMAAGVRDNIGKSAESSAAVFEAAYAKMEARATALRAAIDPAFGAQQRFDREMSEARSLISAGAISLDDYVAKLRQEQAALDAVSGAHGMVNGKTGQQRQSYMMLGQQIQDFSVQVSNGGSIATAFSQQIGQAAFAVQGMGGKLASVGNFLTSGWGIAATVALTFLAPLVAKIFEGGNALEKETKELKDNAEKTGVASRAKAAFSKTEVAARADIAALTEELNKQNTSLRTNAEQLNIRAKQDLKTLETSRARIAGELTTVRATRSAATRSGSQGADVTVAAASARITELEGQLKALDASITTAKDDVQRTRVGLSAEAAKRMADPIAQINRRYDEQGRAAQAAADKSAKAHNVVTTALTRQLGQIEINRAAALKAEQDKQKALGETARQYGREVTSSEASAIARAAGLQVNSADRSTARQQQLYDDWIAKGKPKDNPVAKPGTSAHERGNALDIQFQAGITAKKIKDAFAEEGVRLTKVFAERGHWHVEWARTAAQRTASADATKDARDLAKANKELDDDLDEVVKQFDPARQAADEYATSLAKIAKLQTAGKLTVGQASGYKMELFHQEQKRQTDAQLAQFKVLFGTDDPLADTINQIQIQRDAEVQSRSDDYDKRKDGIRDLANFYRDAMSGGTRSIMDTFKQRGLDAIATMLANWTLGNAAKGTGGLLGAFTKLFGGGAALAGGSSSFVGADLNVGSVTATGGPYLPKLAAGTEYWSGGTALIGEHGPERAWLPKGTRVSSAGATRRMDGGSGAGSRVKVDISLNDAMFTARVSDAADQRIGAAAPGIAAGGAQLGRMEMGKARRRTLGRRN